MANKLTQEEKLFCKLAVKYGIVARNHIQECLKLKKKEESSKPLAIILIQRGFPLTNEFQVLKTGVNVAYELMISKMSFLFNVGAYTSGKERSEGELFQRLTLKYKVYNKLFANLVLSVHMGKAEYVGLGLGYGLNLVYHRKIKNE